MNTSPTIKNKQNSLYEAAVNYNEHQSFGNLLTLINSLKDFSDCIVQADERSLSEDNYAKIKYISDGNFNCCSIDIILELSSECCEMM